MREPNQLVLPGLALVEPRFPIRQTSMPEAIGAEEKEFKDGWLTSFGPPVIQYPQEGLLEVLYVVVDWETVLVAIPDEFEHTAYHQLGWSCLQHGHGGRADMSDRAFVDAATLERLRQLPWADFSDGVELAIMVDSLRTSQDYRRKEDLRFGFPIESHLLHPTPFKE